MKLVLSLLVLLVYGLKSIRTKGLKDCAAKKPNGDVYNGNI